MTRGPTLPLTRARFASPPTTTTKQGPIPRRLRVGVAAGTILMAANLGCFSTTQPRSSSGHRCSQTTSAAGTRITPDTLILAFNDVQFDDMINAMGRQEGFGPHTIAFRARNPGNLVIGPWARKHGAIGDIDGIAVFPTLRLGLNAMRDLIKQVYGSRSVYGMLAGDPEHG
jgi:hypothetical protein